MPRPTKEGLERTTGGEPRTHLEGILFLDCIYGRSELSELGESSWAVCVWCTAMARTSGVLGGEGDEAEDGLVRRAHRWSKGRDEQ